jgi:hypothetical protein
MINKITILFSFVGVISLLPILLQAQELPAAKPGRIDPYAPKAYYFPFGSSDLLRDYAGNRAMFDALDSLLRIESVVAGIDTIQIMASCSPFGSEEYNKKLAQRRAQSMRTYLRWQHLTVAESYPMVIKPVGIDWQGYDALRQSGQNLTEKQMSDLLQYASVQLKMKDGSYILREEDKSPLKSLVGYNTVFPLPPDTIPAIPLPPADTLPRIVSVKDTVFERPIPVPSFTVDSIPEVLLIRVEDRQDKRRLAVGTNLLYDLALLPNLSLEIPVRTRYSLLFQGASIWLQTKAPNYWSYRIQMLWLEGRYWRESSSVALRGAFAGIYGALGSYDIRLFPKGPEPLGTLSRSSYSLGLTAGYSIPVARHWNMEFSLGIGYLGGKYKKYNHSSCPSCPSSYPERNTGQRQYFGPTKAAVSLIYMVDFE